MKLIVQKICRFIMQIAFSAHTQRTSISAIHPVHLAEIIIQSDCNKRLIRKQYFWRIAAYVAIGSKTMSATSEKEKKLYLSVFVF